MTNHIARLIALALLALTLTACMEALPPTGAAQEPAWGTAQRQEPQALPSAVIIPPGGFPTRTPER